jgi:hypothetical protein
MTTDLESPEQVEDERVYSSLRPGSQVASAGRAYSGAGSQSGIHGVVDHTR